MLALLFFSKRDLVVAMQLLLYYTPQAASYSNLHRHSNSTQMTIGPTRCLGYAAPLCTRPALSRSTTESSIGADALQASTGATQGSFTVATNWPGCVLTMDKETFWTWISGQRRSAWGKNVKSPIVPQFASLAAPLDPPMVRVMYNIVRLLHNSKSSIYKCRSDSVSN